jgi:hypothetical protein
VRTLKQILLCTLAGTILLLTACTSTGEPEVDWYVVSEELMYVGVTLEDFDVDQEITSAIIDVAVTIQESANEDDIIIALDSLMSLAISYAEDEQDEDLLVQINILKAILRRYTM